MRAILLIVIILLSQTTWSNTGARSILSEVKNRGYIRCGVNIGLSGFASKADDGTWRGFDVEFCRGLSAAVFGSPDNVRFVGLSGKERFSALNERKIDVLYRNTTMNASRDTSPSLNIVFAGTNYYDGQGFLVHRDKNIKSAYQLDGVTFCITDGSNSVDNLRDFLKVTGNFSKNKIVTLVSSKEILEGLQNGVCDATSSDQSQLYSQRTSLKNADDFVVLPEIITKEPLGPVVLRGDAQWYAVVRWALHAMIEAEFLGIHSQNIDEIKNSKNISGFSGRLLGIQGEIGKNLGLDSQWAYHIINQVGNYGEVFERTIGSQSNLGIARGLNAQWNNGGILYSSPF